MNSIEGPFDLVYIDADKDPYAGYYERAMVLISDRGIKVVDNVLWSGSVADPQHDSAKTMAAFNARVANDERGNPGHADRPRWNTAHSESLTPRDATGWAPCLMSHTTTSSRSAIDRPSTSPPLWQSSSSVAPSSVRSPRRKSRLQVRRPVG